MAVRSTAGGAARVVGGAVKSTHKWAKGKAYQRKNRFSVERFSVFWQALQEVGDALVAIDKSARRADDAGWKLRNQRHWNLATVDEVRSAERKCKASLRVLSKSAKRFEPELIVKDWRR